LQALPGTGNIWIQSDHAIRANFPFENATFVANAQAALGKTFMNSTMQKDSTLRGIRFFGFRWDFS
jgi:hypothetical protein